MRPVTVTAHISAPCEEIFDFVGDLSRRPAFADHYLKEYRLARVNPVGKGAAARFLLDAPIFSERADLAITEYERPRRIVEEGRIGLRGRSRLVAIYDFTVESEGSTRVDLTTYSEPRTAVDRLRQGGSHRWLSRQCKTALDRLQRIFEEPAGAELERVSLAGYDAGSAPRFGAHVPGAGSAASRASQPSETGARGG
jgi:hypothetical protein